MTAQDNVDLVLAYLDARKRGDFDGAFEMVSDDVDQRLMFEMPGSPGQWRGKEGLRSFLANLRRLFPEGTTVEVQTIHGSDNSVVAETINSGVTKDGKEYRNKYCYIYEISNGKISAVREYADSHYARSILAS